MKHVRGFSSIVGIKDSFGKTIPLQKAVDYGWVRPGKAETGWDLTRDEIPLGPNLQLDNFRQYMIYAMTFRAPVGNYVLQRFGVGTGVNPPTVGDAQLGNQIALSAPDMPAYTTRLVDYVSYPSPFTAYIYFTLQTGDANGYLITELGLYSGDQTLLIHWTISGIQKTSDITPTFCHRLIG